MIKTFDFVFDALRSERLMKQLKNALECDADLEICTDIERLYFDSRHKTVTIKPILQPVRFTGKWHRQK